MMRKYFILFAAIVALGLLAGWLLGITYIFPPPRTFLAQVTPGIDETVFFLSPDTGTFTANDTFLVDLKINAAAGVTSVRTYLVFDPARLSVVSLDDTGSAFPIQWVPNASDTGFDNTKGIVWWTTLSRQQTGDNSGRQDVRFVL